MEEPLPAQTTATHLPNPPTTVPCPPPQPPAPTPPLLPKSKKRPLESGVKNTKYFKMRPVVKELRPHFLEVLSTPDFRKCKAAHKIQEQMKLLMDLYKEIMAETDSTNKKSKNIPESQPPSGEDRDGQKPPEQLQDLKPTMEQPQTESASSEPSQSEPPSGTASEKEAEDGQGPGTYVVGGSAFGWNFVTYLGEEAVYYGITKESFRASNPVA